MRLVILYFLLALYVFAPAAEGDLSFSLLGASGRTYKRFIQEFRDALTVHSHKVYGIPVLAATASGSNRFILIRLTNYRDESITVAIDVLDVYVVAYRTGDNSYFFKGVPEEAHKVLFKGTKAEELPYGGNYDSLPNRENIDLGLSEFSSAIETLFYYKTESLPRAFVVTIQTISEAARFKYIEQRISENVDTKFRPDPGFLSLENNWSGLSKQIQIAEHRQGQFERPIELRNVYNKPIMVTNVSSPVVKGIALLRYYKVSGATTYNSYVYVG